MLFKTLSKSLSQTESFGASIGSCVKGGEVIVLEGDIGSGKTSLVKGIGRGLGVTDLVSSPTFTISRVYQAQRSLELHHYDFYRLSDPGIMVQALAESLSSKGVVIAIEWSNLVKKVLPTYYVKIKMVATAENDRVLEFDCPPQYEYLYNSLKLANETRAIA